MSNYTLQNINESLHEVTSQQSGIVLHKVKTITKEYKANLGRTGGMRLVQTRTFCEILPLVVASKLDAEILSYIVANNTKHGVVKEFSTSKSAGINYIASRHGTSRKKVSELMKRAISAGLIKKNKRDIVVNPYIVSPHSTSNSTLYILQTYWDSNFTYDITEELQQAEVEYEKYKYSNSTEPLQ